MAARARSTVVVFSKIAGLQDAVAARAAGVAPSVKVRHFDPATDESTVLTSANIVVADPNLITPYLPELKTTEWLSVTWAGVEGILGSIGEMETRPPWRFTRFSGFFGQAMAEYVIGGIIMRERGFGDYCGHQQQKQWLPKKEYRALDQLSIGILGLGEIGKVVATRCAAMGMEVTGLVRNPPAEADRIRGVTYCTADDVTSMLGSCDYVCNVLPSTAHTRGFLNGKLGDFKRGGCLVNVGRGSVVDEDELVAAIESGQLSGAILDVFEAEPLPQTSKLWTTPGVFITPHVSAISFPDQIAEGFADNLGHFIAETPLKFELDFDAGY